MSTHLDPAPHPQTLAVAAALLAHRFAPDDLDTLLDFLADLDHRTLTLVAAHLAVEWAHATSYVTDESLQARLYQLHAEAGQ